VKICSVVGARPQFIKAAMVSAALREAGLCEVMVHTGQHYDYEMSALFFEQLGLPEPAHNLAVGSDSHGAQTARILEGVERIVRQESPAMVVVYGDTNSTVAAALAAAKLHVPVAHVEAGLRSFNKRMPEEINRVLTDHMSSLLFAPTVIAVENLRRESIAGGHVVVTGDVMYDAVLKFGVLFDAAGTRLLDEHALAPGSYFVVTVHRAENTDDRDRLAAIVAALGRIGAEVGPVLWPIHPRTRRKLAEHKLSLDARVALTAAVGYVEMQGLVRAARGVITDSGGVQKEAAFHGVPTLTLREETEWPETVMAGCNALVGADADAIVTAATKTSGRVPPPHGFGAGDAARVIATAIRDWKSPDGTTKVLRDRVTPG
jgi:UDP-N-acetylglucosamine 2-epimerase